MSNTKRNKIIYFIAIGLLTAIMLMSVGMYFFNHANVVMKFESLGYPAYLIYPLGIAKLLGLSAIWFRYSETLKQWAYAGFFFDVLLAFSAHMYVGDGEFLPALMAMMFVVLAATLDKYR